MSNTIFPPLSKLGKREKFSMGFEWWMAGYKNGNFKEKFAR